MAVFDCLDVERWFDLVVSVDVARQRVAALSRRASDARRRAARAAATAAELESRFDRAPAWWRPQLSDLIKLHRRLEARHLETARLQENYASRLDIWSRQGDVSTASPTFIDAIASAIGKTSAGVTLVGKDGAESLVATSDHVARMAYDVEFVMSEGPAHDVAATMLSVRADSAGLLERWPRYGPAVSERGVGSLLGLPLRQVPGGCLGALCVYDTAPAVAADVAATSVRVADALTHTVLSGPGVASDDETPGVPLFDEADFLATVHQAAGIVSAKLACETSDAVALLRARAFVDGLPIEILAKQVIRGDLQL